MLSVRLKNQTSKNIADTTLNAAYNINPHVYYKSRDTSFMIIHLVDSKQIFPKKFRSSRPDGFSKKDALRNSAKFTGKTCARVPFLIKFIEHLWGLFLKLDKIYDKKLQGLRIRSKYDCKYDWYEKGEKSTKLFFTWEKRQNKRHF